GTSQKRDKTTPCFSLGCCKACVPNGTHICLLYDDEEEREHLLLKFIRAGIICRSQCLFLQSTSDPFDLEQQLALAGIDVSEVEERRLLRISFIDPFYPEKGVFNPDDMAQKTADITARAINRGFSGLRITIDCEHINGS